MNERAIIDKTREFVKQELAGAEGGHDWFHIERVYNLADHIAREEKVDSFVVSLASLLHDVADSKFHGGDEEIGPRMASEFLTSLGVDTSTIEHVVQIIRHVSFKNSLETKRPVFDSPELQVVRDADRLDAIGAIGVARAFNYGGFKNRKLYDPEIRPRPNLSKEDYKKGDSPTINHFYEKLLLLESKMTTKTGKALARGRHEFMLEFLEQFYSEWSGER